jgi:hypothetical protein
MLKQHCSYARSPSVCVVQSNSPAWSASSFPLPLRCHDIDRNIYLGTHLANAVKMERKSARVKKAPPTEVLRDNEKMSTLTPRARNAHER